LEASRSERMRQNGHGTLTLEEARTWIEETGLCLFLPRRQFASSITPTFVEAVCGQRNPTPDPKHIALGEDLLVRLERDGVVVRLNLLGQPGEQPDFVVAAWVLPYVYALRGDRDWRRNPQLTGSRQVSPLAVQAYKLIEAGEATISSLRHTLGREVTDAAVFRAITELWQQLRIIPVIDAPGEPARWQLLRTRFQKAIAEGASTSQVTAISVLASIYLQAVIAAPMEDVEVFLSALTARSKVREVLRGLVATRQVHTIPLGHAPHFYVAGTLPEFSVAPSFYASSSIGSSAYFLHQQEREEEVPGPVVQLVRPGFRPDFRPNPAFFAAPAATVAVPAAAPAAATAVTAEVARPAAVVAAPVAPATAPVPAPAAASVAKPAPAATAAPKASASAARPAHKPASSTKPAPHGRFSRPASHARDRKPAASSSSRPAHHTATESRSSAARPAGTRSVSGHGATGRSAAGHSAASHGASAHGAASHNRPAATSSRWSAASGGNGNGAAKRTGAHKAASTTGARSNGNGTAHPAKPVVAGRSARPAAKSAAKPQHAAAKSASKSAAPARKATASARPARSGSAARTEARPSRKPALASSGKAASNGKRFGHSSSARPGAKKRG
jgi:hypothetical protein